MGKYKNKTPKGIYSCESISADGKMVDASCKVNFKKLNKEDSLELARTMRRLNK